VQRFDWQVQSQASSFFEHGWNHYNPLAGKSKYHVRLGFGPRIKPLPRPDAERRSDPDKIPKGWIAPRRFDTTKIRSVNACFFCEAFL
jgi:hypothetical protein